MMFWKEQLYLYSLAIYTMTPRKSEYVGAKYFSLLLILQLSQLSSKYAYK
jgi:hypothetical protein